MADPSGGPGHVGRLGDEAEQASADAEAGSISFVLDGREAKGRAGEPIIGAAERAGTYIPRFCYHPRMKPVGMCRMCLVEVSGPRGATLQPACFVEVAEGMEVTTTSAKVHKAQDGVLEFLLVNHPLDCPVCDKGGECPLQDQTLAYGPGESRFVEEKRHFEKPIAVSELVLLDRERCIQCARCTRFAEEIAGEPLIDFAGRGEQVEVATFPDRPFTSYFSGNTVQICPVGALTATPYRFTARPWDLDQVESTCTTCALGCRAAVQSSANRLTRLLGIDADPVNHGWLCDKGRFGFESVNGDEVAAGPVPAEVADPAVDVVPATASQVESLPVVRGQFLGEVAETGGTRTGRVTEPLLRKDGELVAASWGEALAAAAAAIDEARAAGGPGAVALIGGARATNEGAYAWAKLAKGVVGTDSVDAQPGDGLPAELVLSLPRATVDQAASAKVVVMLSGDLREELPVLYLRLRQAVVEGRTTLVEVSPVASALTRYAAVSLRSRPGDAPDLAAALVASGPGPAPVPPPHPEGEAVTAEALARAHGLIAAAAGPGEPAGTGVVVVVGRPSMAEQAGIVAEAARRLASGLPGACFLPALRRGNVVGALELGLAPGLLPGRVSLEAGREWFAAAWGSVPEGRGLDAAGILSALAGGTGAVRTLVLVGADPLDDFPDADVARRALTRAGAVVCVAGHRGGAVELADVVLPVAVEHERAGTTTNIEGRVSRLSQKLVPPGDAWPDWTIAAELASELGADLGLATTAEVWDEIERLCPAFAGVTRHLLDSPGARDGVVPGASARRRPLVVDPMATPGVESAERQGPAPRVGLAELPAPDDGRLPAELAAGPPGGPRAVDQGRPSSGGPVPAPPRPAPTRPDPGAGLVDAAAALAAPHVPPPDSYSLRLVAGRRLYDDGTLVRHSPSLAPLVGTAVLRANPYDLDRLGASSGDRVSVRSARGSLALEALATDGVPRGVVALSFGLSGAAASLIDASDVVTEVRMESVR